MLWSGAPGDPAPGQRHGLGDPRNAFWTLVMVDIWHQVSFMVVLLLAGLSALPREPYEAARMEGAGALQTFLHVTLPLMRPVIMVTLLIRLIFADPHLRPGLHHGRNHMLGAPCGSATRLDLARSNRDGPSRRQRVEPARSAAVF